MAVEIRPAPIHLPAPPTAVWDVLADPATYDVWAKVFRVRAAAVAPGAKLTVLISAAPGPALPAPARFDRVERGVALDWRGGVPKLGEAHHAFELMPDGDGTMLTHYEVFSGPLTLPLLPLRGMLEREYTAANQRLVSFVAAHA